MVLVVECQLKLFQPHRFTMINANKIKTAYNTCCWNKHVSWNISIVAFLQPVQSLVWFNCGSDILGSGFLWKRFTKTVLSYPSFSPTVSTLSTHFHTLVLHHWRRPPPRQPNGPWALIWMAKVLRRMRWANRGSSSSRQRGCAPLTVKETSTPFGKRIRSFFETRAVYHVTFVSNLQNVASQKKEVNGIHAIDSFVFCLLL